MDLSIRDKMILLSTIGELNEYSLLDMLERHKEVPEIASCMELIEGGWQPAYKIYSDMYEGHWELSDTEWKLVLIAFSKARVEGRYLVPQYVNILQALHTANTSEEFTKYDYRAVAAELEELPHYVDELFNKLDKAYGGDLG